jgi:hypothetical protein
LFKNERIGFWFGHGVILLNGLNVVVSVFDSRPIGTNPDLNAWFALRPLCFRYARVFQ